jgi:hypothetical protein
MWQSKREISRECNDIIWSAKGSQISEKYWGEVGKGKRVDVYLEVRKRRGHIFFEWNKCLCRQQILIVPWSNRNSNMTSFFRFKNKRASYRLGLISLAHAPVHVTDFSVVNVQVDKLSSARIWQHTLCATLSANLNINYRLPIKVYYRICTLRHISLWLGIKY